MKKWLDNYGKQANYNDSKAKASPDMVGDGFSNVGRNFSPAWGGQFQTGGKLKFLQPTSDKLPEGYRIPYNTPSTERASSIGGTNGEPAYLIPEFKYGQPIYDSIEEFKRTGEHLGGPFKTWQEAEEWENTVRHPAVENRETIMFPQEKFQAGGSIPGSVGFTYARTKGIPSNGPYAKKTLASAQNGKDMYDNPIIARRVDNTKIDRSYYDPRLNTMNIGSDYTTWRDEETGEPLTGDDLKYHQDKMLAHENYHAVQHSQGRDNYDIAHNTDNRQWAEMQKRPELMSTDSVWNNFYNRSDAENQQDYQEMINNFPESRILNQNLLFDKVLDRQRYDNPANLEGEAKFYEETGASFQNGGEMKFYQNGLDFKPKSISRNGGWLNKYEKAQDGYTTGDKVTYGTPEYREAYNKGEVITDEGVRSPIALDEVVIQNDYKRPRGFWEQYRDKIVEENKDASLFGAIIGTPLSAVTSLPQLAATYALTDKMQRPSEAMDIENPYGAFAVDAVTDPTNLIGAGILTKEKALARLSNLKNINAEGKIFSGMNNELNNMAIQNTERYMAKKTPSNVPLSKELEPYISRIGEPSISREEEVFRNVMGHDYRVAKELENTKFLDPDGNLINSDVKQNNFGSIYTLNPLTLFGDDFNKPFLRKIGNSKGIKSLIENEAITSPGYSAPYFSPKTTWEGYNGTFAVGVDPKKVSPRFNKNIKSFDKLGNKTKGGPESLSMYNKSTGDLQRGYQSSWKEIPLEEGATSIYRRLPFTGAYKEIPLNSVLNPSERTFAQKIALNPHLADAQNITEQALRYGIKLSVAQEIANSIFENKDDATPFGNPIIPIKPVINKLSNKKKEGGVIKDDRGQWEHPGEITEIGSNQITMQGVPYDVLGISDTGDTKLMKPGKDYKFKGKKVTEFPMAKNGRRQEQKGLVNLDDLTNFTNYNKQQPAGWLSKYN